MLNFGFKRKHNSIPRAGLLLYLGRPNLEAADVPIGDDTEIGDDTIIRWMFLLPADADIRAATGWVSGVGNIFYDAAGDPVAVFASEIADWADINRYNVLFHLVSADTETGRLAIYALDADHATLNKARRVLREDQYDYWAPLGAILHYDAEIAPLTELVGGVHTLNYSVLGPQYQRLADGSYINVGAQPAVDVLASGIKGLRTCGVVTNLIPNSEAVGGAVGVLPTGWTKNEEFGIIVSPVSVANYGIAIRFSGTSTAVTAVGRLSPQATALLPCVSGDSYHGSMSIVFSGVKNTATVVLRISERTSTGALLVAQDVVITESGYYQVSRTLTNATTTRVSLDVVANVPQGVNIDFTLGLSQLQLTKTLYPQPYVPTTGTSVTQPASNATTTNGTWFALPDVSPLWQALTGSPFTLATRIPMGVGSADLPAVVGSKGIVTASSTEIGIQHLRVDSTTPTFSVVRSYDGTSVNPPAVTATWPRNAVIQRFTQVNTAGTRFRVGYMIEGAHTAIQWSHPSEDSTTWAAFDGSFDPSTLYRFMLGYNNQYPMWVNKITAWKRQVPTTELEAWA